MRTGRMSEKHAIASDALARRATGCLSVCLSVCLALKPGQFFPTAYLRIARRHWCFTLPLPRDFPTAAPLSIPGRARPGRDHYAGPKTGASRHHPIATTTRYPVITGSLDMRTIAGQAIVVR